MSVLFISQDAPWPCDSGGNIRSFHLLKALAGRYPATVVASKPSEEEAHAAEQALQEFCERVVVVVEEPRTLGSTRGLKVAGRSFLKRSPLFVEHNRSDLIEERVKQRVEDKAPQVVHINHLDAWPYARLAKGARCVFDTHNILHEYFARRVPLASGRLEAIAYQREARLLERYEGRAFEAADEVLVCSKREAENSLAREAGALVIPNGVDCKALRPASESPFANPNDLVFVGDLGYEPNHRAAMQFLENVLPAVRERVSDARFVIVGRGARKELEDAAGPLEHVIVTGFVEDPAHWVKRASLVVVPLELGAGTRLKVLEAFALGVPVVSTPLGAEGIECEHDRDLVLAEPAGMAQAIVDLLGDAPRYERLRRSARALAERLYDWSVVGEQLLSVYEGLISS